MTLSASGSWKPEGFVLLPETRAAAVAVRRLANSVGKPAPFVPLVLHGPSGCGKTHLVDALVARFADGAHRCRAAEIDDLLAHPLRTVSLVVIEDIGFLPARSVESFTRLLDTLVSSRRAMVVTGTCGPADLELPTRVQSRLSSGLVVGIPPLDVESRLRLLRTFAKRAKVKAEADLWRHLAFANTSGRQLQAAVELVRHASTARGGRSPCLEDLDALSIYPAPSPTLERLAREVARHFHVTLEALRGTARHTGVLWPRQIAMYLARDKMGMSYTRIGAWFHRDHTTVVHACRKVDQVRDTDPGLANLLRELSAQQ